MKRFSTYLIIFFICNFFFITRVGAQSTSWVDTGYADSIKAAEGGDVNKSAHVSSVNTDNYSDFIRRAIGPVKGITISAEEMDTPYAQNMFKQSALAGVSQYIYAMYANPPASTYAFMQDIGHTLGFLPKQVNAQGIGFSGMTSLLPIWKVFRNISYAILAIVMVVVGFMVMFRKKIDPKTVVTVQNALPKIVVTLLLITFSYAIVGLLIDFMYLVLVLGVRLLVDATPGTFDAGHIARMSSSDFGGVWKSIFAGFASIEDLMVFLFPNSPDFGILNIFNPAYDIVGLLLAVILSIALLFGVVRLFFMLLSAYIQIVLALLTGPIQMLLDALPGGQGFSSWLKNLISNLLVFPITAIMLTVGWILVSSSTRLWTPPLLGMGTSGVAGIIGLGVLLTIPSVTKGVQESLKAKPMINAGIGAIAGPLGAGVGQTMQMAYQGVMIKQGLGSFGRKPDTTTVESAIQAGAEGKK